MLSIAACLSFDVLAWPQACAIRLGVYGPPQDPRLARGPASFTARNITAPVYSRALTLMIGDWPE